MLAHMLLGDLSWLHQPGERLGPSLYGAWLDAPGSQSDARPSDEDEQGMDGPGVVSIPAALLPGEPDLHAVLEAELAGDLVGKQGGLGHQQADQVVSEQ
jgi:hypothetical protein